LFSLSEKRKTTFKTKIQQVLKACKTLVTQLMKEDIGTVDLNTNIIVGDDQSTEE
jgi:hypothetical protein